MTTGILKNAKNGAAHLILGGGLLLNVFAAEPDRVSFGVGFMGGARYDNLRMCVGSPAGVKGGPIADIMLDTRLKLDENATLVFNLPVMRPILFGAAFSMLQFEPGCTLEFVKRSEKAVDFLAGPGLGVSFHYGPDYKAGPDNRGEEFFAAGPFVSTLFGVVFSRGKDKQMIAGLRAFYVPLFSEDYSPGTVIGCAAEFHAELF
ncbi:MAG: hypothetical protein GF350_01595 [Chitinivibrionales bacterium]|nr:hypothetical protein [Chitinivibrionales bacterium]